MSRDRDRTLEQALAHELRAAGTPDRDACLDAEMLGAWADGGLDGAQMAAVESHVSTCARCQAIVGATARSAPLPPGTEAAGTSFLWRWWLAPLTATVAALTLWMVVPQQRDIAVVPPLVVPPSAAPTSVSAPAKETMAESQPKNQANPIDRPPARVAPERSAPADRARGATTPEQVTAGRREQPADFSRQKDVALAAKKPAEEARQPEQDTTVVTVTAAPPAAATSTPTVQELQKRTRLSFAPVVIVSPDPSRRWRIVDGAIERSEDGGASWIATRLQPGDSITGGAAPAPSICWLIGSSGLVMVTADGITFARVPLSERVALTAVTATDARTAIVTAADGRRFRTDDAGRTWRQNQN